MVRFLGPIWHLSSYVTLYKVWRMIPQDGIDPDRPRISPRPGLSPTLWRTCRVLANHRRLGVMWYLLHRQGATVSDVAAGCGISVSAASQCLRALQARGLLRVLRVSRWVEYRVGHDPTVPQTAALVRALSRELTDEEAVEGAFKALTAFTHPRRIRILGALHEKPGMTFSEVQLATRITNRALCRHLSKLTRRGVIRHCDNTYRIERPATPLARVLLHMALKGSDSGQ